METLTEMLASTLMSFFPIGPYFSIIKQFYYVGKQRDFFTRTWGEDFTENQAIPPSPYVCQLSVAHCEKYLKKLRKYCPRHAQGGQHRGHVQSRS